MYNFILFTGETYDGRWNKWYGPSGRNKTYSYNITEIENSAVANAFRRNNISFPTAKMINEIQKNATLSCKSSEKGNTFAHQFRNARL